MYYNFYIISVHENVEIGFFSGTRRDTRLGYQNGDKGSVLHFNGLNPCKRWFNQKMLLEFLIPHNSNAARKSARKYSEISEIVKHLSCTGESQSSENKQIASSTLNLDTITNWIIVSHTQIIQSIFNPITPHILTLGVKLGLKSKILA